MSATRTTAAQGGEDTIGLAELRREALTILAWAVVGIAYALVIGCLIAVPLGLALPPWFPLPLLAGLLLTAGLTHWALRRWPGGAPVVLVIGLAGTLAGAAEMQPGSTFAEYFFLVVLAATGALGWRAGVATGLATSAILAGIQVLAPGVVPDGVAINAYLFIWSALLLAWLPARPLQAALDWAWSSYHEAQGLTREARRRQAELVRVSKSLSDACERLERLNAELQEAREAAEAARRAKAEFAATVGHELRTPVNLIVGFSQLMATGRRSAYYPEPLPDSYRHDLQTIFHNAHHISSLVDDILDLSQIDAHRMALHRAPTSLAQIAAEAAASVAALYAEAGLYLSLDVPDDLPPVPVDGVRIRQVLINLLYNAVRFTHAGGVVVTAYLTDGEAVMSVHDTGMGIPAESLPRLFEEFRQFQAPSRGHAGSGLGLAVCKRFVELHGGNIWAESELDCGTTVSLSLPLHENVATSAYQGLPSVPVSLPDDHPHVAVLDSDGEATRLIRRYLDRYQVHQARRLGHARQLASRGELRALVVTTAEDRLTWQAYQRQHPDLDAVPTLLCPLRPRDTVAQRLGVAAYLTKPVDQDTLTRTLRAVAGGVRRVVVVDDHPDMRALLVRMLHRIDANLVVGEAEDGSGGLALVEQSRPDLVLLDLLLPGQDGYGVLAALQASPDLRGIPVVVVSAKGPDETVRVELVGVSRPDGLTVGEAMACLEANLGFLIRPPAAGAAGAAETAPAPLASFPGSPASPETLAPPARAPAPARGG